MANPLDWLLLPKMPEPSPVKVAPPQGPTLSAYHPKPSERFEDWMYSLLGGGPQASLAHENFARGVPKLLEMFPPLGVGLSAADLLRAKSDNDPMGAAAAAIGMIPGAGRAAPEVRGAISPLIPKTKSSADATEAALKAIEEILGPTPVHAPGPGTPYLMGGPANPANTLIKPNPIAASQIDLLNKIHETPEIPHGWEPMPAKDMSNDWLHPDDFKFENGQWLQKVGLPATKKAGQVPETMPVTAPKKPFWDYEKNALGKYEIFNANNGKTHAWADSETTAQALIKQFEETGNYPKPMPTTTQQLDKVPTAPTTLKEQFIDLPGNKAPSIPAHPPWLDQSAVLPEDAREAARLAGGYTTPAWRGINVEPGKDVGTIFSGDEMFSSNNPKLADMYASNLSKHPGDQPGPYAYREGSSGLPFWINTNDYHVADAKGANWSDFNWKAIQQAKEAGKKGVVIHNVWDEPHSTKALGSPNTIYITFPEGLSTVKSKFAGQFNPNSKDIAKSILATLGVGSTAYPFLQEDNRK